MVSSSASPIFHSAILGRRIISVNQRRRRYPYIRYHCAAANTIPQQQHLHRHQDQQQRTFATQSSSPYSTLRSSSIHAFFQHIETNYGNLSSLFDTGSKGETIVVDDGIIHTHHLVRLMTHDATALHVRNFYNGECAQRLAMELLMNDETQRGHGGVVGGANSGGGGSGSGGSSSRKNWKINTPRGLESSDVMTVGEHMPYNVAYTSSVATTNGNLKMNEFVGSISNINNLPASPIDEYFEGVQREFRLRRQPKKIALCSSAKHDNSDDNRTNNNCINNDDDDCASLHDRGYHVYHPLWPLDKLRLELEEAWPSGAGLAREDISKRKDINDSKTSNVRYARPFGGGLPRIMQGPTRWKRGFIHVDELGPLDDTRGLFSANIYLTVPGSYSSGSIGSSNNDEDWKRDAGALYVWPLGVRSRLDWYRVSRVVLTPYTYNFFIC